EDDISRDKVDWGEVNQPISEEIFNNLYKKVINHLDEKEEIFIFNGYAGADENTRLNLRVVNEFSWHNMFARTMFIRPGSKEEAEEISPQFTVVSAPEFKADPAVDGTKSPTFIIVS